MLDLLLNYITYNIKKIQIWNIIENIIFNMILNYLCQNLGLLVTSLLDIYGSFNNSGIIFVYLWLFKYIM